MVRFERLVYGYLVWCRFKCLTRASFEFKCRTFAALTLILFHPLSPAIWDLWSIMFANPQFELSNYVNTFIFASCYEILWPEPSVAEETSSSFLWMHY